MLRTFNDYHSAWRHLKILLNSFAHPNWPTHSRFTRRVVELKSQKFNLMNPSNANENILYPADSDYSALLSKYTNRVYTLCLSINSREKSFPENQDEKKVTTHLLTTTAMVLHLYTLPSAAIRHPHIKSVSHIESVIHPLNRPIYKPNMVNITTLSSLFIFHSYIIRSTECHTIHLYVSI